MNQYEKLIELIINEQTDKASELFHQIVVEKSREIYENIIDETDFEEEVHDDNQVEDLVNDIEVDKEGLPEADQEDDMGDMGGDDMGDMGGDEMDGDDMDMDPDAEQDEFGGGEEEGGEGDIEDRVMDLEDALDELKAEFDALMSGEEGEESDMMGGDDQGEEVVREYVEKVGNDWDKNGNQGEGKPVGAKSDSVTGATQTKSPGLQKANNMGGKAFDLGKGSEVAPDGTTPKGKAGGFVKPAQEIDVAKRNVNKPGGNKGAQNYFSKKETSYEKANGAEGQTTNGKLPVNPKALQGGKIR
jgi:hypothetical protein